MEETIARLHTTIASFTQFIQELPDELLQPAGWGAREILAHIVFWHEIHAATIEAICNGREPHLLSGVFREFNARAVKENVGASIEQLLERLQRAQEKMEQTASLPGVMQRSMFIKQGSKERSIQEVLERIEAHIRGHHVELRREYRRVVRA
jgi:uncharacterized protein with von Willebrand factor type A (vWA) domain